ncbi:uncharacterized protein LOC124539223 [Vanessa cardui]|uniref:uncharacterized protein LOC124539223 n=1 Tax=Vanessa cardui TaxID=171605 RepID=UPI001F134630|nr:uncharacterized protein LOC124539223 [Vanessa cardui]
MSVRDKWVRRFSIDETAKHKNGFTIYKITSVLFPLESPEAVTIISVWKRYSDIQQLHKSMKSLHSGLHLKGTFPPLAKSSFFKRFHPEVIDERAKTIKALLEFVAEHRLLFTSTDFVNFLQTGYPEPDPKPSGVINAIRSSLHLPIEETPPLEYQTSEDEARSPTTRNETANNAPATPTDIDISQIPIYEAADVEIRESDSDSFESLDSLDSLDSELYDELSNFDAPSVKRNMLPDLINFDAPSTSRPARAPSRSHAPRESETDAELCERRGDFSQAFECYKALVGELLSAVRAETDQQTRVVMKEKINKYLSRAEDIYKNHLSNNDHSQPPAPPAPPAPLAPPAASAPAGGAASRGAHAALPLHVLRASRSELGAYRVLARRARVLLVLHDQQQHCRAMKVIQKIPKNLTEFDDYFHQRSNETRQPILPTLIPYMVPLHAYVETDDLIFLILSYAPGERLFDYIKNYKHSSPNTRHVNLENVFTEQNKRHDDIDVQNDNIDSVNDIVNKIDVYDDVNENIEGRDVLDNVDVSVNELVKNSQKLLLNVDRVLTEVPNISSVRKEEPKLEVEEEKRAKMERETEKITIPSNISAPKSEIPPSAVCRWGAEILTALESLHNCGVIWRDLRPRNVLLGARGHVLLSYCVAYADSDVTLANLARSGEKVRYGDTCCVPLRRVRGQRRHARQPRALRGEGTVWGHVLCPAASRTRTATSRSPTSRAPGRRYGMGTRAVSRCVAYADSDVTLANLARSGEKVRYGDTCCVPLRRVRGQRRHARQPRALRGEGTVWGHVLCPAASRTRTATSRSPTSRAPGRRYGMGTRAVSRCVAYADSDVTLANLARSGEKVRYGDTCCVPLRRVRGQRRHARQPRALRGEGTVWGHVLCPAASRTRTATSRSPTSRAPGRRYGMGTRAVSRCVAYADSDVTLANLARSGEKVRYGDTCCVPLRRVRGQRRHARQPRALRGEGTVWGHVLCPAASRTRTATSRSPTSRAPGRRYGMGTRAVSRCVAYADSDVTLANLARSGEKVRYGDTCCVPLRRVRGQRRHARQPRALRGEGTVWGHVLCPAASRTRTAKSRCVSYCLYIGVPVKSYTVYSISFYKSLSDLIFC